VIRISCPAGAKGCSGTVTLKTLTAVSARATAAKTKKQILTLAQGSFSLAGGGVGSVTLHLSAKAKKLLGKLHLLRAKATVAAHDSAGDAGSSASVVTLRPAKPARHHK